MSSISAYLYLAFKRLMYPGWDIGIRDRLGLARYFRSGDVQTLDAGCGNGAFSLRAYELGNRVIGISLDSDSIARCRQYADHVGVPAERVQFLVWNIYDLKGLGQTFDQIICFEVLEHLRRDQDVLRMFADILHPGGLLHLCTPYRDRPVMYGDSISCVEDEGHVRFGYTYGELEAFVGRAGLKPVARDTVGGYGQMRAAEVQRWIQRHFTHRLPNMAQQLMHVSVFWILQPFLFLDRVVKYPPISIYIMAEK